MSLWGAAEALLLGGVSAYLYTHEELNFTKPGEFFSWGRLVGGT